MERVKIGFNQKVGWAIKLALVWVYWPQSLSAQTQPSLTQLDSMVTDQIEAGMFPGSKVVIMADQLNLRSEPSQNAQVVWQLNYGDRVEVLYDSEVQGIKDFSVSDWVPVRTLPQYGEPHEGFVWGGYIARGAWEMKEEILGTTVITLGMPFGPGEKGKQLILRGRGARNFNIPFSNKAENTVWVDKESPTLASISNRQTGHATALKEGGILFSTSYEACPEVCFGKTTYFYLSDAGISQHLFTGATGSYEINETKIIPILSEDNHFSGIQSASFNLKENSSTGIKTDQYFYFSRNLQGLFQQTSQAEVKKEYEMDPDGEWHPK